MTKRGNAGFVLFALGMDAAAVFLWYHALFPFEAVSVADTVMATITAVLAIIVSGVLTYIAYKACIIDD